MIIKQQTIWNFWADHYETLWAQKYSLRPTRHQVIKTAMKALESAADQPLQILDVGCGTGQLCREMAHRLERRAEDAWKITGVDTSPRMASLASKKAIPGACFLVADVHQLPLSSRTFHLVTCCHSLPYYDDQPAALQELARVTKPGGTVILAQAAAETLYDHLLLSLVKLTTGRAVYPSAPDCRRLLEEAGLTDIRQAKLATAFWMPSIIISSGRRPGQ